MSAKRWPLRTRVEVEWRDSGSLQGWARPSVHKSRREVGPCRSIGYLLTKDHDVIQLAQSMSVGNGDVNDVITIPREAVTRIRRIEGGLR